MSIISALNTIVESKDLAKSFDSTIVFNAEIMLILYFPRNF